MLAQFCGGSSTSCFIKSVLALSLSLSFVFCFFKFTAWINFYSLKQGQSDDFPVLFLNLETIIRLRQPIQALI